MNLHQLTHACMTPDEKRRLNRIAFELEVGAVTQSFSASSEHSRFAVKWVPFLRELKTQGDWEAGAILGLISGTSVKTVANTKRVIECRDMDSERKRCYLNAVDRLAKTHAQKTWTPVGEHESGDWDQIGEGCWRRVQHDVI